MTKLKLVEDTQEVKDAREQIAKEQPENTITPSELLKALTKAVDKVNGQLKATQAKRNGDSNE